MSDIENGKGGGSFYSVQDREGGGWVGQWPTTGPRANVKQRGTISITGGWVKRATVDCSAKAPIGTTVMSSCH